MHDCYQVLICSNPLYNRLNRNPDFVLVSDYYSHDLFVQLNQQIATGASDKCHQNNLFYFIFLLFTNFILFGFPISFN